MRKRHLVAAGIASATLLVVGIGPAFAPLPPPPPTMPNMNIQFVSAKLVARGVAVNVTLNVTCDNLANFGDGYEQNPAVGMINFQLSQATNRGIASGFVNWQFDPSHPNQQVQGF